MKLDPYLYFDGRSEEAIEFYRKALSAELVMMMRFKEAPDTRMNPPGSDEKIMHATLRIGETTVLVSDGNCGGKPKFDGFALALRPSNDAEAEKIFQALSEGGKVSMPLAKTFFASSFGMLADRFGVPWMVVVERGNAKT
jgi:PhnB protein